MRGGGGVACLVVAHFIYRVELIEWKEEMKALPNRQFSTRERASEDRCSTKSVEGMERDEQSAERENVRCCVI